RRRVGNGGEEVLAERYRQREPALIVEDLLQERCPQSLDHAARELVRDDAWVDHHAAVVDEGMAQHPGLARLLFDLDLNGVNSAGVHGLIAPEVASRLKPFRTGPGIAPRGCARDVMGHSCERELPPRLVA